MLLLSFGGDGDSHVVSAMRQSAAFKGAINEQHSFISICS